MTDNFIDVGGNLIATYIAINDPSRAHISLALNAAGTVSGGGTTNISADGAGNISITKADGYRRTLVMSAPYPVDYTFPTSSGTLLTDNTLSNLSINGYVKYDGDVPEITAGTFFGERATATISGTQMGGIVNIEATRVDKINSNEVATIRMPLEFDGADSYSVLLTPRNSHTAMLMYAIYAVPGDANTWHIRANDVRPSCIVENTYSYSYCVVAWSTKK